MNKRLLAVSVLFLTVLGACSSSDDTSSNRGNRNSALSQAVNPDKTKVTLCHATASFTNPFTIITIDSNALKAGHGSHRGVLFDGKTKGWGDIIPPSTFIGADGKVWTNITVNWPEGKEIYENYCAPKEQSSDDGSDDNTGDDEESTTTTLKTSSSSTSSVPVSSTVVAKASTTTTVATTTTEVGDKVAPTTTVESTTTTVGETSTTVPSSTSTLAPTKVTIPEFNPPSDPDPTPTPTPLPVDPEVQELVITPEQVTQLTGGEGTLRVSIDAGDYIDVPSTGITLNIERASNVTFSVASPGAGGERYVSYNIVRPSNTADDGSNLLVRLGPIVLLALVAWFLVAMKKRKKRA